MNTIPTFQKKITLVGKPSVHLLPNKNWRELAAKGVKSAAYHIQADASVGEDQTVGLNIRIPAVKDGMLVNIESTDSDGELLKLISSICPQNDPALNVLEIAVDADGKCIIGEDGLPVFKPGQDIPEGYGCFGMYAFCPTNTSLTLELHDVNLAPTDRTNLPYYDVTHVREVRVVRAEYARAEGSPITLFTPGKQRQAARKTAEAAPAQAVTADIRM